MATCKYCGRQFSPSVAESEYDSDSYICNHSLEGTYGCFDGLCAEFAITECMESYPQGLEDCNALGDDD